MASAAISEKSRDKTSSIEKGGITVPLKVQLLYDGPQQVIFQATISQEASTQPPLPSEFVLKPQFVECPDDAFLVEESVYNQLAPLQGKYVPRYFGVWTLQTAGKTVDTHVIDKVDGKSLEDYTLAERFQFKDKILRILEHLSLHRVVQGDVGWRHFLHTESGELRLIDFDQAEICQTVEEARKQNKIDVETLFKDSLRFQKKKERGISRGHSLSTVL